MNPILVLGSKVVDGRVDPLLASRLDRAAEIAGRHPHVPVVVSGLDEAAPMADYLRARGVQHLLEEPRATSTNENLENALALLPDTRQWTVVTSDFHAWRTYLWAWHLGIPITVVTAITPAHMRTQMFLRECLALPHSTLRVLWRKFRG
ncbi:YdcF family protein [uncultured Corynebacterium sp.]|uniref:YdcF family protein n=1 Tax=uncultured Corynebacterium sp. TaxID=159447 RepID=UPI0025CDF052|nr:YdcF family protein [uncultured Corynebacterium sp.]